MLKLNSDTANKTIKNLQTEIDSILSNERRDSTYSHAVGETPSVPTWYNFADTQKRLSELRNKIGVLRHAINQFNVNTKIDGFNMTVDEALYRMHLLNAEKKRLHEMLDIPEVTRTRNFGSREADIVHRNFDIDSVRAEYDSVTAELMAIQQAINIANLTCTFDVDI